MNRIRSTSVEVNYVLKHGEVVSKWILLSMMLVKFGSMVFGINFSMKVFILFAQIGVVMATLVEIVPPPQTCRKSRNNLNIHIPAVPHQGHPPVNPQFFFLNIQTTHSSVGPTLLRKENETENLNANKGEKEDLHGD